jgi:retron-type reverse transcriptase
MGNGNTGHHILKRILKAPIKLENDELVIPTKGTPQGGLASSLLANIVLNELDRWVKSQWQDNPVIEVYSPIYNAKGVRDKSHGYTTMRKTKLKEMYIVRYADDCAPRRCVQVA